MTLVQLEGEVYTPTIPDVQLIIHFALIISYDWPLIITNTNSHL